MVGAGKLMALLVGVPYKTAIIGVGILMVGYVVFGGMTATTWVQIIKAGLLVSAPCCSSVSWFWPRPASTRSTSSSRSSTAPTSRPMSPR